MINLAAFSNATHTITTVVNPDEPIVVETNPENFFTSQFSKIYNYEVTCEGKVYAYKLALDRVIDVHAVNTNSVLMPLDPAYADAYNNIPSPPPEPEVGLESPGPGAFSAAKRNIKRRKSFEAKMEVKTIKKRKPKAGYQFRRRETLNSYGRLGQLVREAVSSLDHISERELVAFTMKIIRGIETEDEILRGIHKESKSMNTSEEQQSEASSRVQLAISDVEDTPPL